MRDERLGDGETKGLRGRRGEGARGRSKLLAPRQSGLNIIVMCRLTFQGATPRNVIAQGEAKRNPELID